MCSYTSTPSSHHGAPLLPSLDIFKPFFIEAPGGVKIRCATFDADPAARTRGVCVLLQGQSEFMEKYQEVIDELRGRGFTVATMDWRGQGGSQRGQSDPLKSYVKNYDDYAEDFAAFMAKVVTPLTNHPPIVLAHSMGGHNTIRAVHDHPDWFRCAVTTAPMLKFSTRGYPQSAARAAAALYNALGKGGDFAWGMAERDPFKVGFDSQLVTSDRTRFEATQALLRKDPDLRLSGPTWGFIEAAYRSLALVNAPGYPESISTPMLIVGAGKDRIVLTEAERSFVKRLPHGEYLEIPEAEHEILMEQDSIRAKFWTAFDSFVGKYVP
ncbi:MAG TPA: alpha/beta hydrolase [Rhizomicrobium sp.]|nr:alpha/beta hydrolase [Rhizomicrobium sp.]